jgi:hypothetical protein
MNVNDPTKPPLNVNNLFDEQRDVCELGVTEPLPSLGSVNDPGIRISFRSTHSVQLNYINRRVL